MKCGVCGKYIALTVAPYQRIYKDEDGHWKPTSTVCQCDPDDICLFGLIARQKKRDAREKAKQARL
jgi:hypothetical protein